MVVKKNQKEKDGSIKDKITPPNVIRIINKSKEEKLLIAQPFRRSKVNIKYDTIIREVNILENIINSIFQ